MSELLSRVVVLVGGTLYPAYRSYKAVRTKDVREYVKWMMYWIVFALFQNVEAVADVFLAFWFPFYYQLKIVFVIWLLSPWTKGASILYRKWVHPALTRREKDIDLLLDQAKSESYNQMVRLGSQGLMCAKDIVATAALRGQAQIVQQLQKSYSANDVSQAGLDDGSTRVLRSHTNDLDQVYEEEEHEIPTRPARRSTGSSGASGAADADRTRDLPAADEPYPATMPRMTRGGSHSYYN